MRWRASRDRPEDVLAEAGPLAQGLIPGLDVGQPRPRDRIIVPAVHQDAVADIRQGQVSTGEVAAASDEALNDRPAANRLLAGDVERSRVALVLWGAVVAEQHRGHGRVQ